MGKGRVEKRKEEEEERKKRREVSRDMPITCWPAFRTSLSRSPHCYLPFMLVISVSETLPATLTAPPPPHPGPHATPPPPSTVPDVPSVAVIHWQIVSPQQLVTSTVKLSVCPIH